MAMEMKDTTSCHFLVLFIGILSLGHKNINTTDTVGYTTMSSAYKVFSPIMAEHNTYCSLLTVIGIVVWQRMMQKQGRLYQHLLPITTCCWSCQVED